MTLKTSVFAAMPSASTTVATAVTAGAARLDRIANRRSVQTAVNSQAPTVSCGRAMNHSLLGRLRYDLGHLGRTPDGLVRSCQTHPKGLLGSDTSAATEASYCFLEWLGLGHASQSSSPRYQPQTNRDVHVVCGAGRTIRRRKAWTNHHIRRDHGTVFRAPTRSHSKAADHCCLVSMCRPTRP